MKTHLIKLTLKQLIGSGMHVGYSKKYLNRKLKSYLLGHYNHFYIINLYYTNYQLRFLINLIINLVASNQQIWFLKSTGFFLKKNPINQDNLFIFNYKWIHGFITNFKLVRQHWFIKDALLDKNNKAKLSKSEIIKLHSLKFFPSLVIFFDDFNQEALKEVSSIGIPTAGIIDLNFKSVNRVNYPIISNNNSFTSLVLYYNLFYNAICKGIQNEQFHILSLNKKL